MIPAEIATLKALCDEATPGPWRAHHHGVLDADGLVLITGLVEYDAAFIAAARTAVPALLSALEEARRDAKSWEHSAKGMDLINVPFHEARAKDAQARAVAAEAEVARLNAYVFGLGEAMKAANQAMLAAESRADALQAELGDLAAKLTAAELDVVDYAEIRKERDALQAEVERIRVEMRALERLKSDADKVTAAWVERADALQAEVESLLAGISYAVKRREEETARADAAWRAALEAATCAVLSEEPGRESMLGTAALGRAAARIRALPPPSATPNEETEQLRCDPECSYCREWRSEQAPPPSATAAPAEEDKCPECKGAKCHSVAPAFDSMCPECGGDRNWHHQHACPAARLGTGRAPSRGEVGK